MKAALILLSVFALSNGASISTLSLLEDVRDLWAVIPVDEYRALVSKYLQSDQDFVNAVAYLQSDSWKALVETVAALEEVQSLHAYLTNAGIPVATIGAAVREIIANADTSLADGESDGSVRAFIDEARALFPTEDFLAVLNDKMENSADFQEFYALVSSDTARGLVEKVRALDEVQHISTRLRELGMDVDAVLEKVKGWLGWN